MLYHIVCYNVIQYNMILHNVIQYTIIQYIPITREAHAAGVAWRSEEAFHHFTTWHDIQEGIRNRTEPAEPNRTAPNRLIPEPAGTDRNGRGTEPNRTEPDRTTTGPKSTGRTASNREEYLSKPNRTEPNRNYEFSKSPEPKRIEPNWFLPVHYTTSTCIHLQYLWVSSGWKSAATVDVRPMNPDYSFPIAAASYLEHGQRVPFLAQVASSTRLLCSSQLYACAVSDSLVQPVSLRLLHSRTARHPSVTLLAPLTLIFHMAIRTIISEFRTEISDLTIISKLWTICLKLQWIKFIIKWPYNF